MNPKISIIIVNWNGKKILQKCLESLRRITKFQRYEVIVIDNGSEDSSGEMILKEFGWVRLIENKENLGFSKATNQGIKIADGDYILLLNNDIEITQKDWLDKMIDTAESNQNIGVVGCRQIIPSSTISDGYDGDYPDINEVKEVGYLSGNSSLIKKVVIDKIGLLDEGFSPFLYEDADFFKRAKKCGYKLIYNPNITVIHHHSFSIKKVDNDYVYFVNKKNRLRFQLLNYPFFQLILSMIQYEFMDFFAIFLDKKYQNRKETWGNIKIRRDYLLKRFLLFFKAYFVNLKDIYEILRKRGNRTGKIWY